MIFYTCFLHRSISIFCSRNFRLSILKCLKNGSKIPGSRRTFNFWWVNNFWNDQAWVFLRRVFPQKVKESLEISKQNRILRSTGHNFPARVSFQCSSKSCFFHLIHKLLFFQGISPSETSKPEVFIAFQNSTRPWSSCYAVFLKFFKIRICCSA